MPGANLVLRHRPGSYGGRGDNRPTATATGGFDVADNYQVRRQLQPDLLASLGNLVAACGDLEQVLWLTPKRIQEPDSCRGEEDPGGPAERRTAEGSE